MLRLACLLSTHADRQGIYRSLFVWKFVRLRISLARIKLAATNFARRFVGVLSRESHIFEGTLLPYISPKSIRIGQPPGSKVYYGKAHRKRHARDAPFVEYGAARGRRSACVDIGQCNGLAVRHSHVTSLTSWVLRADGRNDWTPETSVGDGAERWHSTIVVLYTLNIYIENKKKMKLFSHKYCPLHWRTCSFLELNWSLRPRVRAR